MSRIFTCGGNAIVAAYTIATDIRMIENRSGPTRCDMAIVANLTTCNMTHVFTDRGDTVMTTLTSTDNSEMVHLDNGTKVRIQMTKLAVIGGIQMLRSFTYRGRAIVATNTSACYTIVVESRAEPSGGLMALATGVATGNMAGVLSSRGDTIVTTLTGTNNRIMVNAQNRNPADRIMAILATIGD